MQTSVDNTQLSMIHFNCRRLKKNFDNMNCFDSKSDIIGLTETWLKESECTFLNIPNYAFLANNRTHTRGAGVGIYVHKDVDFKRRHDLEIMDDVF